MDCTHDIADKDTAIADGLCPLCLDAEVDRLRNALISIVAIYEKPYPEHSPLTRHGWQVHLAEQMRDLAKNLIRGKVECERQKMEDKKIGEILQRYSEGQNTFRRSSVGILLDALAEANVEIITQKDRMTEMEELLDLYVPKLMTDEECRDILGE